MAQAPASHSTATLASPLTPIAIVFGGHVMSDQEPGPYLKGRLDTALPLFQDGLVETIIISGDAIPPGDDEVAVMRHYLQDRGIPPERLIDDARGFDTDGTCRRARTVFGRHQAHTRDLLVSASRIHLLVRA